MSFEHSANTSETRGFSGLASMVSKIDLTILPKAKVAPPPPPVKTSTQATVKAPSRAGMDIRLLLMVCAVIGGLVWIFGSPGKSPPKNPASPGLQAPAPAPSWFAVPQVGRDLVLGGAEISYCLAESIRIEAGRESMNNYVAGDVALFNVMVEDWNSRCGQYKYRPRDMKSAQETVTARRADLEAEGRKRFYKAPAPPPAKAVPPPRHETYPNLIESVCNNGQWGNDKAAIAQCVATQRQASPPDWSKRPAGQQKTAERACRTERTTNGEAAYNTCLWRQLQYFRK